MFDLLIVGGGPAGYRAAERAAEGGLSVALMEKEHLGGVCLNEGCIPSKSLLYAAKTYAAAKHGEAMGILVPVITLDHGRAMARKSQVVQTLVGGVGAKMKKAGVTVVTHAAQILGRKTDGFHIEAGGETYVGKRILLATGSQPVIPPIAGLSESIAGGFALTNREILSLAELPSRLCIVGGGVIGLEMADYYAAAGSQVTVIEMLDHIGGPMDGELSSVLQKELEQKGIVFHLGAKVTQVGQGTVAFEQNGSVQEWTGDKVLLSVGRKPSLEGYGLETLGVATQRGAVVTDAQCRTSIAAVWAAGDINGKSMLAHTAYREAEAAVNDMLGVQDGMDYRAIPGVVYTFPEVASVGLTLEEAQKAGHDAQCSSLSMRFSGRYMAEVDKGNGICKIVYGATTRRILGAHLLGSYASEIIHSMVMAMECRLTMEDIQKIVFPHPTVSEIIRETAFEAR